MSKWYNQDEDYISEDTDVLAETIENLSKSLTKTEELLADEYTKKEEPKVHCCDVCSGGVCFSLESELKLHYLVTHGVELWKKYLEKRLRIKTKTKVLNEIRSHSSEYLGEDDIEHLVDGELLTQWLQLKPKERQTLANEVRDSPGKTSEKLENFYIKETFNRVLSEGKCPYCRVDLARDYSGTYKTPKKSTGFSWGALAKEHRLTIYEQHVVSEHKNLYKSLEGIFTAMHTEGRSLISGHPMSHQKGAPNPEQCSDVTKQKRILVKNGKAQITSKDILRLWKLRMQKGRDKD